MSQASTILVADDERDLCGVLEKVLTKEGYRVLVATTGREALARLKKENVNLLLLDLKMPGIDGLEVLKRAKKAGRMVPTVIVTAYGSLSSAREAMELEAIDYLAKPFDLKEVVKVVKEALE